MKDILLCWPVFKPQITGEVPFEAVYKRKSVSILKCICLTPFEGGDFLILAVDFRGFQSFNVGLEGTYGGTLYHEFGCPKSHWSGAGPVFIFQPIL